MRMKTETRKKQNKKPNWERSAQCFESPIFSDNAILQLSAELCWIENYSCDSATWVDSNRFESIFPSLAKSTDNNMIALYTRGRLARRHDAITSSTTAHYRENITSIHSSYQTDQEYLHENKNCTKHSVLNRTRCSRRRQTSPPVPPSCELDETYASSLIWPTGLIMWKHDVMHNTGCT